MRSLALLAAGSIHLASPTLARADCHAGDALLEAGDHDAAIRAYEAAAARPECAPALAAIRINEGYARERRARATGRAEDACEALYAWRRALPGASERAAPAIEGSIAAMDARCVRPARIVIDCAPAGATVRVEGLTEPRPCPASLEGVPPGRYAGVMTAAGIDTPFSVEAKPGETARIEVTQPTSPVSEGSPIEPALTAAAPVEGFDLTAPAWIAAGLAVAATGVATYGALWADDLVAEADALNEDAERFNADPERSSDRAAAIERERARLTSDHALATDLTLVSSIAAGVFAAAAVTLFVLDPPAPARSGAVRLAPGGLVVTF